MKTVQINLTERDVQDLVVLVNHAETDISYNEGGSYNDGYEDLDLNSIQAAERAINLLEGIIKAYAGK